MTIIQNHVYISSDSHRYNFKVFEGRELNHLYWRYLCVKN